MMPRTTHIQLLLLMLVLGFLTGPRIIKALDALIPAEGVGTEHSAEIIGTSLTVKVPPKPQTFRNDHFAKLNLAAKGVFVWDITAHRKLYGKDEYKALPLASVTKMMMALVAAEVMPEEAKVVIRPADLLNEGDSGLYVNEEWKLADLINFTLVASSNDGASAIASVAGASLTGKSSASSTPIENKKLFIQKMNEKARSIGLINTYFKNESGLDIGSVAGGAYGSPRDMAILFEYILHKHPELFTATTLGELDVKSGAEITHRVINTNPGVARINGLIGSKTGYTDLAGGNLVVVVDVGINHPVVIAVLGSTREQRFTDVDQLLAATVKTLTVAE